MIKQVGRNKEIQDLRWNPELAGARLQEIDLLESPILITSFVWRSTSMPRMHRHEAAQLVFSGENVVEVRTEHTRIVVPPNRGVWVPSGMQHETLGNGTVHMHSVFVHARHTEGLPSDCMAIAISPLLREMIFHAAGRTEKIEPDTPEQRLSMVIFDQLRVAPQVSLRLPMPTDRRALAVCEQLIKDPADERTIRQWGDLVGASSRTLSRLFVSETGMNFHYWRQQVRLQAALPRLADGESVTQIALDLGYQTPSAFIAMFRSILGITPKTYFQTGQREQQ